MKKAMYDASVIISSFNQADTIKKVLDVLEDQSRENAYSVQVIIADDGSRSAQVNDLIADIKNRGSSMSINFVWQQNTGFRLAASRNNGLALAGSEIIIFIDGDCIPNAGFLDAHIKAHTAHCGLALFTGHRSFDLPENMDKDLHKDTLQRLRIKETEEAYDIKKRAGSVHPWSSIIGRNFSFRHKFEDHKFDENIVGWGAEDISFAAEYFSRGCRLYSYLEGASVTQIDDFSSSSSPFETRNQRNIAYAIANAALTMKKFEEQGDMYRHMALFLAHYTIPFVYEDGEYNYDNDRASQFFREAVSNLSYSQAEAGQIYGGAIINLVDFFNRNPDIKTHPYIAGMSKHELEGEIALSLVFHDEFLLPECDPRTELLVISKASQSVKALNSLCAAEDIAALGQDFPKTRIIIMDENYDESDIAPILAKLAKGKIVYAQNEITPGQQTENSQPGFDI